MTSNGPSPKLLRVIGISLLAASMDVMTVTSSAGPARSAMQAARSAPRRKQSHKKNAVTPEMISEAQQRLADIGYWIEGVDGKWGEASRHGLIAFQKVEGRFRTGKLTIGELQALRTAARPSPRERSFAHIEVDLKRQVLFMVDAGGTVSRILPVSTGNGKLFTLEDYTQPAVTPAGRFRVYRKLPGWRKSPLGLLYYPSYIVGGIAIHGNPAVPSEPASHGCIRIPMFAAEEFSNMTPIGTEVIVYDGVSTSARDSAGALFRATPTSLDQSAQGCRTRRPWGRMMTGWPVISHNPNGVVAYDSHQHNEITLGCLTNRGSQEPHPASAGDNG